MIFAATFIAFSMLQMPSGQDPWGAIPASAQQPGTMIVFGTPELTPGEAYESAQEQAQENLRRYFVEKGTAVVERSTPVWLPGFVEDRILGRWIAALDLAGAFRVLDREQIDRDHGHSMSYQTRLLIKRDPAKLERSLRSLKRDTAQGEKWFLATCGGTAILWAALALLCGWMDRLTRGYMSNRLRLLFSGLGLCLPAIAFLIV